MTSPTGRTDELEANSRHHTKSLPIGSSPVGKPVFIITSRAKRSGFSLATVSPSNPPQYLNNKGDLLEFQGMYKNNNSIVVHLIDKCRKTLVRVAISHAIGIHD